MKIRSAYEPAEFPFHCCANKTTSLPCVAVTAITQPHSSAGQKPVARSSMPRLSFPAISALPLVRYVTPGKEVSSSLDLGGPSEGKTQTSDAVCMGHLRWRLWIRLDITVWSPSIMSSSLLSFEVTLLLWLQALIDILGIDCLLKQVL